MNANLFRATTKYYMELNHIKTREQLRAHTTVGSHNTFKKYWDDPDLMPLGIFEEIMTALNVPKEEKIELLTK